MIESISLWFARAIPEPTERNLQIQISVHLEEVEEMLRTLEFSDPITAAILKQTKDGLGFLSQCLKQSTAEVTITDRNEFLDAICDQIVTATGCGHMANMKVVKAVSEVNSSNWSKFDENGEPIFDANGKITKGPRYRKPDLNGMY